jgi:hypothetical protein
LQKALFRLEVARSRLWPRPNVFSAEYASFCVDLVLTHAPAAGGALGTARSLLNHSYFVLDNQALVRCIVVTFYSHDASYQVNLSYDAPYKLRG